VVSAFPTWGRGLTVFGSNSAGAICRGTRSFGFRKVLFAVVVVWDLVGVLGKDDDLVLVYVGKGGDMSCGYRYRGDWKF
jgi:hypothetical protein